MDGDIELLRRIYERFNAPDIDGVLAVLADDVAWANGRWRPRPRSRGRAQVLDAGPLSVRMSSR